MPTLNGAQLILAERRRQVEAEHFDAAHDAEHIGGELIRASRAYGHAAWMKLRFPTETHYPTGEPPSIWPWAWRWWKHSPSPIRDLEKAGALLAAEIDRLLALEALVHCTCCNDRIPEYQRRTITITSPDGASEQEVCLACEADLQNFNRMGTVGGRNGH